jgi:hypothetical protein
MMNTKVILQLMVFSLVFTMLVTRQAWGEEDCYLDKEEIKSKCKDAISLGGDYVQPSAECCAAMRKSNMACICRNLSADEQLRVLSVSKLIRVSRQCHNPVAVGSKCGGNI